MSITVSICICTFRRAHIANTLASMSLLEAPLDCAIRVIVADNDDEPTAQVTVRNAAAQHNLDVTYLHVPARNISLARNACLDAASGDYLAFIDDDEVVTPHWLAAMLARAADTDAPIILGPVHALYADTAPRWLQRGNFHSTYPTEPQNSLTTGYTGNAFIQRNAPALSNLRFNLELGTIGGEDTDFFRRAHAAGATIAYAPDALVYEGIPPERANLQWLRARRIRFGQTHAAMLLAAGKTRLYNQLLAAAKTATSFAMMAICGLSPIGRRRWYLRGIFHLAVVRALGKV